MMTAVESCTSVRHADPHELPALFAFGQAFYAEMQLPGTFIPSVALSAWRQFMTVLPAVILVAEADRIVTGMLGAIITPDHYDNRLTATEMFWYVDPGAAPTTALSLLRAYHRWAQANAAVETRLTHMLAPGDRGHDADKLKRLYRAMGYRAIEVNYLRTVPQDKEGDEPCLS